MTASSRTRGIRRPRLLAAAMIAAVAALMGAAAPAWAIAPLPAAASTSRVVPLDDTQPPSDPVLTTIRGRIVSPAGVGVTGVRVLAGDGEVLSGVNGAFELTFSSADSFGVTVLPDPPYLAALLTNAGLSPGTWNMNVRTIASLATTYELGNLRLTKGTMVSGTVEASGLSDNDDYALEVRTETWGFEKTMPLANGTNAWSILVAPGDYAVGIEAWGPVLSNYWSNAADFEHATTVAVGATPVAGIALAIAANGITVAGTVRDGQGLPFPEVRVALVGAVVRQSMTRADGTYTVSNVPPGTYTVHFYYTGGREAERPGTVTVASPGLTGINGVLTRGGTISGAVTTAGGSPVFGARITVYESADPGTASAQTWTDTRGRYRLPALSSGSYYVRLEHGSSDAAETWFAAAATSAGAQVVALPDAQQRTADFGSAVATARFAGANRFATAAAITAAHFEPGVETVFLANGAALADALAAAPVAGDEGSPILLVQPSSIPAPTAAELARLAPKRIVLLGGTGVIDASVPAQAAAAAGLGIDKVERWSGVNRYDTAAAVSQQAFAPGVDTVFVANGTAFVDALAAAPVAGGQGSPILLVTAASVPPSIAAELARLAPRRIVVLGDAGVVSDATAARVRALAGATVLERWAGPDRYSTAASVAANAFPAGAPVVFIANGSALADALAGAPVAAMQGAPILLVRPGAVPSQTMAAITALDPSGAVLLGGTGVIATSTQKQVRAALD